MIVKVENIDHFNHYFHQPTYHPLVSVGRLQDADLSLFVPNSFIWCPAISATVSVARQASRLLSFAKVYKSSIVN